MFDNDHEIKLFWPERPPSHQLQVHSVRFQCSLFSKAKLSKVYIADKI